MKIKLLNDAGYGDMENVKFPAEVEARREWAYFAVSKEELYRVGANPDAFDVLNEYAFAREFCEVVS